MLAFQELDFLLEARNNEMCVDNFRRLSPHIAESIYAPKIYWNLSTSRLLTMEFIDAAEVTDVKAIKRHGLRPHDVSKLVSEAFAEMIFKHGFVHCDPHAANLMVRPLPNRTSWWYSFLGNNPLLSLLHFLPYTSCIVKYIHTYARRQEKEKATAHTSGSRPLQGTWFWYQNKLCFPLEGKWKK